MKTKSRTYCLWKVAVAIAMVLLLALVPHHHHMGAVCWLTEVCADDGRVDDEHTQHGAQQVFPHVFFWQSAQKSVQPAFTSQPAGGPDLVFLCPTILTLDLPLAIAASRRFFTLPVRLTRLTARGNCPRRGPPALVS